MTYCLKAITATSVFCYILGQMEMFHHNRKWLLIAKKLTLQADLPSASMQMCVSNMDAPETALHWSAQFPLSMTSIWASISTSAVPLFADYIIKVIIINMRLSTGFKECTLLMGETWSIGFRVDLQTFNSNVWIK